MQHGDKTPAQSQIVLNTLMMPEHANHFGNVHGGIIMKLADESAAIAAMRHAQRPAVTVAMDSMTFDHPVHIGEIVTCTATITYTHNSSMEVTVHVTAEEPITGKTTHTNSAHLVFVALDEQGRPAQVPALILSTDQERELFEEGQKRQERRLAERKAAKLKSR
jgi:acyl-CoA hydrolase